MRKLITTLFCLFTCFCVFAQIGIGMRDARYFNVHYTYGDRFYSEIEQSAFSAIASMQKTRLYIGYQRQFSDVNVYVRPYFSVFWNGDFDYGANLSASYSIRRFYLSCILNPHYDNCSKFSFRFKGTLSLRVFRQVGVFGYYTTISPYRTEEKSVGAGIWAHVGKLTVAPSLAIPFDSPEKYIRIYCSMNYEF